MTPAERLAREILRVGKLRQRIQSMIVAAPTWLFGGPSAAEWQVLAAHMDGSLEQACLAIGSGDEGRIEAAGLVLTAIDE